MLDLKTLEALNKFWQDKFDRRHPEAARRRDDKDREVIRQKRRAKPRVGEPPRAKSSPSKRSAARTSKRWHAR